MINSMLSSPQLVRSNAGSAPIAIMSCENNAHDRYDPPWRFPGAFREQPKAGWRSDSKSPSHWPWLLVVLLSHWSMRGGLPRPRPGGSGLPEREETLFFCPPMHDGDRGFGSPSIIVLATSVTTAINNSLAASVNYHFPHIQRYYWSLPYLVFLSFSPSSCCATR